MIRPHVLADSSIWIDHIHYRHAQLADLLKRRRIVLHPMVIGEVALGSIKNRDAVLAEMEALPKTIVASHCEVLDMIERLSLYNCGIGFVDAHLFASARLASGTKLLTRDKPLLAVCERFGLAAQPTPPTP